MAYFPSECAYNVNSIPIMKDGMATCLRCGNVGVKDTFYGKGKQYCSANCVRGISPPSASRPSPLFKKPSTKSQNISSTNVSNTSNHDLQVSPDSDQPNSSIPQSSSTLQNESLSNGSPDTADDTMSEDEGEPDEGETEKTPKNGVNVSKRGSSSSNKPTGAKFTINTFNWIKLLEKEPNLNAAPVSTFSHCPLSDVWDSFICVGLKLEVESKDVSFPKNVKIKQDFYWIASVVKVSGYFVLLRYEGFDNDSSKDFWVNICTSAVHPVGWCASQGKILVPPRSIADKCGDWKAVLVKRLSGSRTLPDNFHEQLKESMKSRFRVGMKLEVVDKGRISALRVATIDRIVGSRLHLRYEGDDENQGDNGFWCHQESPLIHPVGWAQVVGHELKATQEYARRSLEKTIDKKFDPDDADWSLFPVHRPLSAITNPDHRFKEGMKLEAIDPLNLATICVATVTKVLRNNHLMVGIDGMMARDGSDWFCYPVSSPNIFPVGFCMLNGINLTPPRGYDKKFDWFEYLKETQSIAAPVHLFKKDIPSHGFREGMYLEAVDVMVPRLICVATVAKVVGRLLRIHFNGWDETYDQWCDCEAPELYPIGWCSMVGYPLEPPKGSESGSTSVMMTSTGFDGASIKKKRSNYRGKYKRRKRGGGSVEMAVNRDGLTLNGDWEGDEGESSERNSSVTVKPSPIQAYFCDNNVKLPDDVREWSVDDVCQFLRVNECGAYCTPFWNQKIDGNGLLNLTRDDILELTCKKLGPSLKIFALIQSIKGIKK